MVCVGVYKVFTGIVIHFWCWRSTCPSGWHFCMVFLWCVSLDQTIRNMLLMKRLLSWNRPEFTQFQSNWRWLKMIWHHSKLATVSFALGSFQWRRFFSFDPDRAQTSDASDILGILMCFVGSQKPTLNWTVRLNQVEFLIPTPVIFWLVSGFEFGWRWGWSLFWKRPLVLGNSIALRICSHFSVKVFFYSELCKPYDSW